MKFDLSRRAVALLGLVVMLGQPALADPVDDLTALVRSASQSSNPVMAFLQGAAALPDFNLGRADIQRALQEAGVPANGPLAELLGPGTGLQKVGDQIIAQRSRESVVPVPGGAVGVGKVVRARVRQNGPNDFQLTDIQGIRVGENMGAFRDLYELGDVRFRQVGGRLVAEMGVKTFFGRIPKNIDLGPANSGSTTPAPAEPEYDPAEVKHWQERLRAHGYDVSVDGRWGPNTEQAVKDFQADHGLTADGKVGPKTLAALDATPVAPTSAGIVPTLR